MKRVIVTADDFGLSRGVVEGIIESHQQGIVTATSVMVAAPASEEAFRWARALPSLAAGLHFVLTFGAPVGPPEPLAELLDERGRFRRVESGAHARARADQVRSELRAQLRRFEDGVGRPPTHIDGHHHVHVFPGVLRAVIEEAGRLGVPVRAPDGATRARLGLERIRTTDAFIDGFYGDHVGEDALIGVLETLPEGTSELMCHPAREDDRLTELSAYVEPRYRELEALVSPRVKDTLARAGIELARY